MKGTHMKQSYPIWKFHAKKNPEGLIVRSEAEDKALGDGWVESPAQFEKASAPEVKTESKPEPKAEPKHEEKSDTKAKHKSKKHEHAKEGDLA
jgi:hypothetical protein